MACKDSLTEIYLRQVGTRNENTGKDDSIESMARISRYSNEGGNL